MPAHELFADQAAGLRRMHPHSPVRVVAVASGKGGVGKSSVSVNLSLSLIRAGRRVMLLDADFGLANVDVLLGLQPQYNLSHVLEGRCTLQETLIEGPMGLQVVPAASGRRRMAELHRGELVGLIRAFSQLEQDLDVLVVDSAAGISGNVTTLSQAAQEVVVVVCNEPASITDAYALIKVLSQDHGLERVQVVANAVRNNHEGRQVYDHLHRVTERFLDVTLGFLGSVPHDETLQKAVRAQRAVVDAYPGCKSSRAFADLARRVDRWALPTAARGGVEFFVERLVGPAAPARVHA